MGQVKEWAGKGQGVGKMATQNGCQETQDVSKIGEYGYDVSNTQRTRVDKRARTKGHIIAFYVPVIYTAPCVMLLIRSASITWASGRGLCPGNRDFLGPVKWHRADKREPFGAQKSRAKIPDPPIRVVHRLNIELELRSPKFIWAPFP
jgi:hypothetical protein